MYKSTVIEFEQLWNGAQKAKCLLASVRYGAKTTNTENKCIIIWDTVV